ncbi:MAG: YbhB/YbcL family Raf kinase inhibitor-like protein [Planctomycetia bacterium]|nr:YbhB/YbcL family Raf kinase inhibitor-like protein [Planctomycetia bacterium]
MTIEVTSTAFAAGQPVPRKHTGDGVDHSPPLSWSAGPAGTKSWALICDDPDAPTPEPWVHWLIYNLPAGTTSLPENVAATPTLGAPAGAAQGKNSWGSGRTNGYRGPAPPPGHGVHHYHFKVYALDAELNLKPGLDKKALLAAMKGHVLDEGELVGTYQR